MLYDWLSHSHLVWPSLSMCWGGVIGFSSTPLPQPHGEDGAAHDDGDAFVAHTSTNRAVYYATRTGGHATLCVTTACAARRAPRSRQSRKHCIIHVCHGCHTGDHAAVDIEPRVIGGFCGLGIVQSWPGAPALAVALQRDAAPVVAGVVPLLSIC